MILYFGNKLSKHGFTKTSMEELIPKLELIHRIKSVSDKKNRFFRMLDMVILFFSNYRKTNFILIDIYSGLGFYYAFIISCLSQLYSIPYLHGGNLPVRLATSKYLSKIIFSNSYINISPSLYLKEKFINQGYIVKYIPNFININLYDYKKRNKCKPNILWVRSFHEIYNPQMAILVLSKLLIEFPEARLCMFGPDKYGSLL